MSSNEVATSLLAAHPACRASLSQTPLFGFEHEPVTEQILAQNNREYTQSLSSNRHSFSSSESSSGSGPQRRSQTCTALGGHRMLRTLPLSSMRGAIAKQASHGVNSLRRRSDREETDSASHLTNLPLAMVDVRFFRLGRTEQE